MLAPAEYKALHPIGSAPVITDGDLVLANPAPSSNTSSPSMATAGCASRRRRRTSLTICTGSISRTARCTPGLGRQMIMSRRGSPADGPSRAMARRRSAFGVLDARLAGPPYLAGEDSPRPTS